MVRIHPGHCPPSFNSFLTQAPELGVGDGAPGVGEMLGTVSFAQKYSEASWDILMFHRPSSSPTRAFRFPWEVTLAAAKMCFYK